jgi:hypothetical protein
MKYPELNTYSDVLCLEGEIWKDIKDFEGYYQVSNLGRVKRLDFSVQRGGVVYRYKGMVLKANNDTRGYPQLVLNFNTKRTARVHRLVAEAFLQPPSQELMEVCKSSGLDYALINHIDENKFNPAVSNLEWCSSAHNNSYGKSRKGVASMSGSASKHSILVEEDVTEILRLLHKKVLSQEKIANLFGVKQITISNIWTGRSWSHFTGIPWKERSWRKHGSSDVKIQERIPCH